MHLSSIQLNKLLERIESSSRSIAIVIAPNFEERSISFVKRLLNRLADNKEARSKIWWFMITLQGDHPPQILDAIKARNAQRCWKLIEKNSPESFRAHEILLYPAESRSLGYRLDSFFREMDEEFDLIIDYSSIPRSLLTQILNEVSSSYKSSARLADATELYLTYTWADGYPQNTRTEFVGEIMGHYSQTNLEKLIANKDLVDIVVFSGGNVHDVAATMELLYRSILGKNLSVSLCILLNDVNMSISQENMRNNYKTLLDTFSRDSSSIRFVFSVDDAYEFLSSFVSKSLCNTEPGRGFLGIAPFGPKPVGVAAHFALTQYASSNPGAKRGDYDILTVSDAQYLSVYSLGEGLGHVFEIVR